MPNYKALQIPGVTFTGALPGAADLIAPTAPGSVTATRSGITAGVTWTAATDAVGVVAYDVHRSVSTGFTPGVGTLLATVTPPTLTWADPTPPTTVAYYKVVARDAGGNATAGTQATLPALSNADLLVNGSLVLFDPADSTNAWVALGAVVPNLADTLATATIGSSAALSWSNALSSPGGLVERSTKGGLHMIVSQVSSVANNLAYVGRPAALHTYLQAHVDHDLYMSASFKITRLAASGSQPIYPFKLARTSTADYFAGIGYGQSAGTLTALPGSTDPHRITFVNDTGPSGEIFVAISTSDAQAGFSTVGGTGTHMIMQGGIGSNNNLTPSFLAWRMYVEDLTVSGRTHAQVYAIDHAIHTKEVLTVGGRYYGDTYSNPVTVMP